MKIFQSINYKKLKVKWLKFVQSIRYKLGDVNAYHWLIYYNGKTNEIEYIGM